MRRAASSSPSTPSLLMLAWAYMPVGAATPQHPPRPADCRGDVFAARRSPRPALSSQVPLAALGVCWRELNGQDTELAIHLCGNRGDEDQQLVEEKVVMLLHHPPGEK